MLFNMWDPIWSGRRRRRAPFHVHRDCILRASVRRHRSIEHTIGRVGRSDRRVQGDSPTLRSSRLKPAADTLRVSCGVREVRRDGRLCREAPQDTCAVVAFQTRPRENGLGRPSVQVLSIGTSRTSSLRHQEQRGNWQATPSDQRAQAARRERRAAARPTIPSPASPRIMPEGSGTEAVLRIRLSIAKYSGVLMPN